MTHSKPHAPAAEPAFNPLAPRSPAHRAKLLAARLAAEAFLITGVVCDRIARRLTARPRLYRDRAEVRARSAMAKAYPRAMAQPGGKLQA